MLSKYYICVNDAIEIHETKEEEELPYVFFYWNIWWIESTSISIISSIIPDGSILWWILYHTII